MIGFQGDARTGEQQFDCRSERRHRTLPNFLDTVFNPLTHRLYLAL
jgi:hypothetical protein